MFSSYFVLSSGCKTTADTPSTRFGLQFDDSGPCTGFRCARGPVTLPIIPTNMFGGSWFDGNQKLSYLNGVSTSCMFVSGKLLGFRCVRKKLFSESFRQAILKFGAQSAYNLLLNGRIYDN